MRIEYPVGLLLLAAVPLAALLLLRRLRRRERPVAAFLLIRDLMDALPLLPRSYLWRRRLQTALFLLGLTCAALAAGLPVLGQADDPPQRAIILIDHLPAGAQSGGADRAWRRLVESAAGFARSLRADDRVILVRSDAGLIGDGPLTPRQAAKLLEREQTTTLPDDPEATFDLIGILERAHRPALVTLFTPDPRRWQPHLDSRGSAVQVVAVPGPTAAGLNHAILDVEVRPDFLRPGRIAIFCRTGSFGPPASAAGELVLTVERNGEELARRSFGTASGQAQITVFPALDAGSGLLRITLAPADGFTDDNVFLTPLRGRAAVAVRLVSEGNRPLEAALRAIPGLELSVVRPGTPVPAGSQAAVEISDSGGTFEPAGNTLVVAPPEGFPGIGYRGDAAAPRIVRADPTHFLLAGVSLENLRLKRLPIYRIPSGMDVLATADGHPLLAAGRTARGARIALLAFDPRETGWSYSPSFPILVANLLSWLAESPEATRSSFRVGDFLPEPLAGGGHRLIDPTGRTQQEPAGGWQDFRFPAAGRWRIEGGGATGSGEVFVNLLDERVSAALAPSKSAPAPSPPQLASRPFRAAGQVPLLIAALVLLLLEQLVAPVPQAGRLR